MLIDFTRINTAEARAAEDMATARAAAQAQILLWVEAAALALTGAVPLTERMGWAGKEQAARAMLAKKATREQKAQIAAEAAETGEADLALAAQVIAAADAHHVALAALTGQRRQLWAALETAPTRGAVSGIKAAAAKRLQGGL